MKLSKQKALQSAGVVTDPRFSRLHSDPRFQRPFKRKLKIPIDSRFRHIFSDKRFSDPLSLDKRGRKRRSGPSKKRHALREYYELRDDEDFEDEEPDSDRQGLASATPPSQNKSEEDSLLSKKDAPRESERKTSRDEENDSESNEDDSDDSDASSESSTTTSSSSDYENAEDNTVDSHDDEELENEKVPTTETETRRLALVNMDWDHIKAVDILAVMNSFLPKGGHILSVTVYPSEFGLQQMKEEEKRGPQIFSGEENEEEEEEEDEETINEKLRKYERAKLRYYYAIVECDSSATADFLYKSCDGMEFERTSNTLDLRFVADDMKFTNEPRDVAKEVPSDYQAPAFETRALQHSKVKLTWDDDESERVKVLHQKFSADQLNEMDFKAYLASDASSEEIEDNECKHEHGLEDGESNPDITRVDGGGKKVLRDKYRALLLESGDASASDSADDKDMEITFNSGLEELSKRLMEKNKKKNAEETVWEAYLRKRREKRKARKQETHEEDEEKFSSDDHNVGDDPYFSQQNRDSEDFFLGEDTVSDSERELYTVPASKEKGSNGHGWKSKDDGKLEEKRSRAELELLLADEFASHDTVKGYNLKKRLKGKRKEKESISDKLPTVNFDDPRFSALFTSHLFAVDPTEPEYKRSAANLKSLLEKQQKRLSQVHETSNLISGSKEDVNSQTKAKQDISLMVRSLKRKVATV